MITGGKFLADFGMAKAILNMESESLMIFTIIEREGKEVSITETVAIKTTEIRSQLLLVTWKEVNGNTVTQVHDYEKGIVYSNWTTPGGEFKNIQGVLTPL